MTDIANNNFEIYISPITIREWMKWLTYIPDFKEWQIKEINKKRIDELSCEELEIVLKSKKEDRMLDLLNKFNSNTIKEDEYIEIKNYMDNESIEDLMKSKLTDKEIIKKVEHERQENIYSNLSMVDAYTFHLMLEIYYIIEMKKLDNQAYFSCECDKPMVLKYSWFN